MADLLESIAAEIEARRAKLKPMIVEHERLQAAAAALDRTGRYRRPEPRSTRGRPGPCRDPLRVSDPP